MSAGEQDQRPATSRIGHLLESGALEGKTLMVVGLGSLGFPAMQQLAMSGLKGWVLVDFDTYEEDNLVKHVGMRRDLGKLKIDVAKEWLLDRNPSAKVTCLPVNIATGEGGKAFKDALASCDALLVTTDNRNSRLVANRAACERGIPMVVSTVFRTGFGGEAFLYHPTTSGCYECLIEQTKTISIERTVAESKAAAETEQAIQDARYGRIPDPKFGLSGLASDIASVAALAARFTLTALLDASINDGFLDAMQGESASLSRLEAHMLALPYQFRGGERPKLVEEKTVWLNSTDGQMYGAMPVCSACENEIEEEDFDPEYHRCCSWCGAVFSETLAEERNIKPTPVEHHWRPISTMTGHGVTHVSIITRRHLIDDIDDDGNPTSRLRVAFQPFEMKTNHVDRLDDCPWCQSGDAA